MREVSQDVVRRNFFKVLRRHLLLRPVDLHRLSPKVQSGRQPFNVAAAAHTLRAVPEVVERMEAIERLTGGLTENPLAVIAAVRSITRAALRRLTGEAGG